MPLFITRCYPSQFKGDSGKPSTVHWQLYIYFLHNKLTDKYLEIKVTKIQLQNH